MMNRPTEGHRKYPLARYWPLSVVLLVVLLASGILVWSFSPAHAKGNNPQATLSPKDDNPPYAIGPTGAERYGGNNPSENGCSSCAGDPIDTYSGNFFHTFTDFSIPGRGVPLLLTRTYNAQAAAQNSPFGYGWSDSYNMYVDVYSNIFQENGSEVSTYQQPIRVLGTYTTGYPLNTFTRWQTQIHYNFNTYSGLLVSEVDRNGYTTNLTYNTNNQLTSATDPEGRSLTFTYNTNSQIASITDPNNRTVSYTYDTNGNLISVTDVNGGITKFTYDANHLLLTMTDPNGGVLTNTYDSSSRVISQKDAVGRTTTFSYATNVTTITDPNGNITVETYKNALLASRTTGYGTAKAATWTYAYNPYCNGLMAITDPNKHTLYQTWSIYGDKLSMTNQLGRITKYTYDNLNDLTSQLDANGVLTTLAYDANGNLLSISTPLTGGKLNRTITFGYADTSHPGDITSVTDPNGKMWSYTYDANGDRITLQDPLKNITISQYNVIGWMTSQSTALKHTTSYSYNNFGDVTQITDPLGYVTTSQYDANQNLIKVTDATGNITQYSYDLDNELTQVTRADGSILAYKYDNDGNQISYTDGLSNKTSYAFGNAAFPNLVTSTTDPLNRTTSYGFDLAGNRITVKDAANQTTTYAYDAAKELTGISYSDGKTPNVTFTYDGDGQRIKMTDGTGSTTYSYDSLNRLTQTINGAGSTVAYTYDLKGNVLTLKYPNGQSITRTYDNAGRLATVKDWLGNTTKFAYDPDSNLTTETYANGVKATFKYDHNDQLTNIADALGTTQLLGFVYTRNKLNLLASTKPTGVTQGNETYNYTSLNQLSTVNQPTYQYDHGDNLTQIGTATLTYDAANELKSLTQSSGTTTYTYDARGNLTQQVAPGGTTNLTYDQANRLISYGTTAQYSYNGDGLRMSKTVSGTAEAFTWDMSSSFPLLLQDATTNYLYGPGGQPLEQISSSNTVLYYHQDQLGSTRALTNSTGSVVATYTYDAYGNVTAKTGTITNPLQYAEQYSDAESGLLYLRARYYSPNTGQFLTRDPLVALTQQAYGYGAGDPLNETDATGRNAIDVSLDVASMTLTYASLLAVDTVAAEPLALAGAALAGGTIAYSVGSQLQENNGDWSKVNWTTAVLTGVGAAINFIPGLSALGSGAKELAAAHVGLLGLLNDLKPSSSNSTSCLKGSVQYTDYSNVGKDATAPAGSSGASGTAGTNGG